MTTKKTQSSSKTSRPRWHQQLADADALLDEATQLAGRRRREYLVAAARLIAAAGNIAIPRDPSTYSQWKLAITRAEEALFAASGEYPSSLALAARDLRRIDAGIAAGRADVRVGRVAGPFDSAEEGIAYLHGELTVTASRSSRPQEMRGVRRFSDRAAAREES